ncbi:MAG: LysM peptidoglycan-binding domain-containing protein, partial [Phycisphaerales bacterium]
QQTNEPLEVASTPPDAQTSPLADPAPAEAEPPVEIAMGSTDIDAADSTLADAGATRPTALDDFLAWSEKQGVRFDEIGTSTPLAETTRRPSREDASTSRTLPELQPLVFGGGSPVRHVVQEGETLWGIAQRYYGDGAKHTLIQNANEGRMGKGGALYVGAELVIPNATAPSGQVAEQPRRAETTKAPADAKPRYHTVKKGETLGEIALATLGSSKRWPEIVKLNPRDLADPDNVPVGARLKLPPQ